MNILYSGFDTLIFAVKGAANPVTLKYLELVKNLAVKAQQDTLIEFNGCKLKGLIAPKGTPGGFAYLLKIGGELGHVIQLKHNLSRNEWNAHVKIRALSLAIHGWETALEKALIDLDRIGFSTQEISLNRVDYAMDFQNTGIVLDPTHFIAHSRVKKAAYKVEVNAFSRGQSCETVTIGKMPNRQVSIYDKRRETIEKRKPIWFEIWRIDPTDITQTVHRVEIRLGKKELTKSDIRTFDDFKERVNMAMTRAVQVVRYVEACEGLNRSRWPNQPLWNHVQSHVQHHVLKNPNYVDIARVKHVIRSQKAMESRKQVLGNMANLSVFEDMPPEQMKASMVKFVQEHFSEIEAHDDHPFWKSRAKTQDRFSFL